MKKGFTLIELLAVIVILAIIAAIAIPIVINIINDTKTSSQEQSVEMYLNAVELSIANNITNTASKTSGKYEIIDNGKRIKNQETKEEIKVGYKGNGLTEGIIEIKKGKVTKLRGTKINGKYAAKVYDKIEFFDELPEATLTTGQNFNSKIKTLVRVQETDTTSDMEILKSIGFFSYGRLPKGYTKEELLKLDQVDVSNKQDKSILALHDGSGNVFIYSEGLIFFNANSYVMFNGFQSMTKLILGLVDTSNTIKMGRLFSGCNSLIELDIKYLDTSNVTQMYQMFNNCSSLKELDVSNFDTSKVTNMQEMFRFCEKLITLDLSNFDTSSVTDMGAMFEECRSIKNLNLHNFDTSNVPSMARMFNGCNSIESLDLRSFNTSSVTDMSAMFRWCSNLTLIEVSNKWIIGEDTNITNMFNNCGTNTVTLK